MTNTQPEFNETKFRELILYVAKRSEDDPRFGATKLNKILYFADFNAYRKLRQPITGATYQNLTEGPAPREMLPQRHIMIDNEEILIEERTYFDHIQQRIIAHRSPNKEVFSSEELSIVDEVIAELWNMTGRVASEYSHDQLGWQLTKLGETILYETAWLSAEFVPQEAEVYGRALVRKLGQ